MLLCQELVCWPTNEQLRALLLRLLNASLELWMVWYIMVNYNCNWKHQYHNLHQKLNHQTNISCRCEEVVLVFFPVLAQANTQRAENGAPSTIKFGNWLSPSSETWWWQGSTLTKQWNLTPWGLAVPPTDFVFVWKSSSVMRWSLS